MIKKIKVLPSTSKSFSKTALRYCWLQALSSCRRLQASKASKAPSISTKPFEFTPVLRPKTTATILLLTWEVSDRFLPIELTPLQLPVQVNWTTSKTKLLLFREDSHRLLATEPTLLQPPRSSRFDFNKIDFRLEDSYISEHWMILFFGPHLCGNNLLLTSIRPQMATTIHIFPQH